MHAPISASSRQHAQSQLPESTSDMPLAEIDVTSSATDVVGGVESLTGPMVVDVAPSEVVSSSVVVDPDVPSSPGVTQS